MQKMRLQRPGPHWGAHDAPLDPLVGWGEDTPPQIPTPNPGASGDVSTALSDCMCRVQVTTGTSKGAEFGPSILTMMLLATSAAAAAAGLQAIF